MTDRRESEYFANYEQLLGFVPSRFQKRIEIGLEVDPETVDKVEDMRRHVMFPKCFDVKTSQLILFAVLLSNLTPENARIHAIAAKRAGATKEELHAVVGLTFLFSGLGAFNFGCEIIDEIFDEEKIYS